MATDFFYKEQRLLDKSFDVLQAGKCSCTVTRETLEELVKGYSKLLRQSRRLVTMGDRMQLTLNDLNHSLSISEQKYRGIFENVTEGIYRCSPYGDLVEANPALASMFGYSEPDDFMAAIKNIRSLFCNSEDFDRYQELLAAGELKNFEVTVYSPKGSVLWVEISASVIHDGDDGDACRGVAGVLRDVTERKAMMEEMCRLARIDSLTGLWNRGYFMELAGREILRTVRGSLACSLILIDVDYFKKVNDNYGHDVGDVVLVELAGILCKSVREIDIVARIGGEEFIVLLPQTPRKEARIVAERIKANVRGSEIRAGRGTLAITVSQGLCAYQEGDDLDSMIKHADIALYAAKANGRDRIEAYRGSCEQAGHELGEAFDNRRSCRQ